MTTPGRYVGGPETEFETEKSDVGLDEYEPAPGLAGITTWPFPELFELSLQPWGEKDAPDRSTGWCMLPRERFGPTELLRWLEDTQDSNERAKRSHAKRRAAMRASTSLPELTL